MFLCPYSCLMLDSFTSLYLFLSMFSCLFQCSHSSLNHNILSYLCCFLSLAAAVHHTNRTFTFCCCHKLFGCAQILQNLFGSNFIFLPQSFTHINTSTQCFFSSMLF